MEGAFENTFFSVQGLAVSSEFAVDLAIVVQDMFGETTHRQAFPFIVRSRKNGEFINDLDSMGARPSLAPA